MSRKSALNSAQKRTLHTLGRGVYLIAKRKDTPKSQLRAFIAKSDANLALNSAAFFHDYETERFSLNLERFSQSSEHKSEQS